MKTLIFILLTTAMMNAEVKPPCCREVAAATPLADKSLYQLESTWTSDMGKDIKLSVLRGRPQVVAMFFTSCEYACPIIVENMKTIERAMPESLRDKVDFLLVSFDVKNDTVEALKAYRTKRELTTAHWSLLRGKEDDVRELAALLGINYQRDARGQFSHSNTITLLNAEGEIVFQQAGLNKEPKEMVTAIEKLISVKSP
jgi:protein SCO1/2